MKKAVFITVRSDSSRLPGKAFLEILGRPTIEMVMLRAKQVAAADVLVLCTTERKVDDRLVELAEKNGVRWYRGSLEDKLERWRGAARAFGADCFATMDGDDLFCDPELIALSFGQMEREKCDFIRAPRGLICGSFTYCISVKALEKVCGMKGTADTEMMWVYFEDTGEFSVADLAAGDRVFYSDDIRMTLDYQEDLDFFKTVFERMNCPLNDRPLRDIVAFLGKEPEVARINSFRQQDYLANQKRKTHLVLKKNP